MSEPESTPAAGPTRRARYLSTLTLGYLSGLSIMVGAYAAGDLSLLGDFSQAPYLIAGLILGGLLYPIFPIVTREKRPGFGLLWIALGVVLPVLAGLWNYLDPVTTNPEFTARGLLSAGFTLWVGALWSLLSRRRGIPVPRSGRRWWLTAAVASTGMVAVASVIYIVQNYAYFPETILGFEVVGGLLLGLLVLAHRNRPPSPDPVRTVATPPRHSITMPILLAALLCLGPGLSVLSNPTTPSPAAVPSDLRSLGAPPETPIRHMVIMMLENHAFDNIFGGYPSDPLTASNGIAAQLSTPKNLLSLPAIPSFLSPVPNGSFDAGGPTEGYSAYHLDVDGGKMDGFLQNSGPASVTYLTSAQVAPEWDWAEEYGLGDRYFAPMLTETNPNRLYGLCGFSPVINDYGPPPQIPYDQCIFSELQAYGVSLGYYVQTPAAGLGTLDYITGISPQTPWIGNYDTFFSEAAAGTLPDVTWMQPVDGGVGASYDQLPGTLGGTQWLLKVVDSLMTSPDWNSTAIFITYDEGGGFYDQAAPPTLDWEPLGQRVPFLVISPYAKENYVSHTLLNHDSMIAFAEYNWHLPALNSFVAASGLPLDFFDFGVPRRSPVVLTAAQGFPVPASMPFPTGGEHISSLAPLFPQPLQIPLVNLPYARQGSTSVTLGTLGSGVYTTSNFGTLAIYESPFTLVLLLDAELVAIPLVLRRLPPRSPQG